jgi:hypothetical protein
LHLQSCRAVIPMEAVPLFLLILLPPADTTGDVAAGMQASLRRELGDVTMAVAPDTLVTPAMLRGERAALRARFVANVGWATRDKATVELHASASGAGVTSQTRVLTFAPQDGKLERGRAIGLVLAELLRESSAAAFAAPLLGTSAAQAPPAAPSRLAPGAWFATDRVKSGNWAMGPELGTGFALTPAWWLQATGRALFGMSDQYFSLGFGVAARWDFLRARDGTRALGIGLGWEVFRESAKVDAEEDHSASIFNLGFGGTLAGRIAIAQSLRLVGAFQMQASLRAISLTLGEDANCLRTCDYSHWRPGFSVGLELLL